MLRLTQLRRYDQFREAQRPIAAAFTIKDTTQRLAAMHTITKSCVLHPHIKGRTDFRRHTREANALLLATMSYCRSRGGWREALEVASLAHRAFQVPLKKEWIPLCLEGAHTAEERQLVLEGLTHLYGALPAELYTKSSTKTPKLLFDDKGNKIGGGDTSRLVGEGNAGNITALEVVGDSPLALTTSDVVSPAAVSAQSSSIAAAAGFLSTSPQSIASIPSANPSFISYLTAQNIARTPTEVQLLISALTGRPMTGVVGANHSTKLATSGQGAEDDPSVQQALFMRRPVVVRVNRSNKCWKAVRELLRRQTPFLEPLPWYPEELAWVMASPFDLASTAGKGTSVGQGGTLDRTKLLKLRATQLARVKHLLQTLVDEGLISFQSASSMMPAIALCGHLAVANQQSPAHIASYKILDLCAAPGGKTQQVIDLLAAQQDSGTLQPFMDTLVVANDADERRLKAMRGRLGGRDASVAFTHFSAEAFPLPSGLSTSSASNTALFDGVLLDAPCTGEGRMHRDSAGWKSWHPRNCLGFHKMQLKALRRAIAATKEGGIVVYSTCTMNPLENEAVVAAVVEEGLVDVVPVTGGARGKSDSSELDRAIFDGQIPQQLMPFISKGLSNWGVPLPNGEYTRPVAHMGDEEDAETSDFGSARHSAKGGGGMGTKRLGDRHKLPKGIEETMLPPVSEAIARMVAGACVRITPFPRYDGAGAPPRVGEGALNQMESFFMCKLKVKVTPQKRVEIAAEDANTTRNIDSNDHGEDRVASRSFRFKNANKFSFVSAANLMMSGAMRQSASTALLGRDPNFIASETFKQITANYGITLPSFETAVAEVLHTPSPRLALRAVVESQETNDSVFDVFAMSGSVADFLASEWTTPTATQTNASHGSRKNMDTSTLDLHNQAHFLTLKTTKDPKQQQLLSPGTCLLHSIVNTETKKVLTIPTQIGATVIASAAAVNPSSGTRVIDVPIEFLQHLIAMYQPIPEAILRAAETEQTNSADHSRFTTSDALMLLSGLLGRAASAGGAHASIIGPDSVLPYPAMSLNSNTFDDPKARMARSMKGTGDSTKEAKISWIDTLLNSPEPSQSAFNGPVVLNVKVSTKSRRSAITEASRRGFSEGEDGDATTISLPALVISTTETPSGNKKGLSLSKLQGLMPPGSSADSTAGTAPRLSDNDNKHSFIILTCNPETVSQLKVLLPRVLGSSVNAERNVTLTALDRVTKHTELLETVREHKHMFGYERKTAKSHPSEVEGATILPDASLRPLIQEPAPASLIAARKHITRNEVLDKGGKPSKAIPSGQREIGF